jgi:hypothetical protein
MGSHPLRPKPADPLLVGERRDRPGEAVTLPVAALLRHVMALGSSGSGKTVFCKVLAEEAALRGIPVIAIDPQGDLASLALAPPAAAPGPAPGPDDTAPDAIEGEHDDTVVDDWAGVRPTGEISAVVAPPALHDRVDVVVFTPASQRGVALSADPVEAEAANLDHAARVRAFSRTAGRIASLLGYDLDGDDGAGLIAVFDRCLNEMADEGRPATSLRSVTERLEQMGPAEVERYGRYLNERKIRAACQRAARLDVGARRLLFHDGVPIDIDVLLGRGAGAPPPGKTRVSIIYLNTLEAQEDKDFVVATVAGRLVSWMLQNPSPELQALFYIDEVAPFMPPVRKPACKEDLQVLFKQARKFGVGCVVATQNPGDVDYKAMGQFGTWALGRLATRQDLKKVEPSVKSLMPAAAPLLEEVPSLRPGELVLLSPDNFDEPCRLATRWLHSDHRTLEEEKIEELAGPWRQLFAGVERAPSVSRRRPSPLELDDTMAVPDPDQTTRWMRGASAIPGLRQLDPVPSPEPESDPDNEETSPKFPREQVADDPQAEHARSARPETGQATGSDRQADRPRRAARAPLAGRRAPRGQGSASRGAAPVSPRGRSSRGAAPRKSAASTRGPSTRGSSTRGSSTRGSSTRDPSPIRASSRAPGAVERERAASRQTAPTGQDPSWAWPRDPELAWMRARDTEPAWTPSPPRPESIEPPPSPRRRARKATPRRGPRTDHKALAEKLASPVLPSGRVADDTDVKLNRLVLVLASKSSMTAAEFAERAGMAERTARARLRAMIAAGHAGEFREERTIKYWARTTGTRPDLGMKGRVLSVQPVIDHGTAESIGRGLVKAKVLGILGQGETFAEARLVYRMLYRVAFQEKVKRPLLGRLIGPSHEERLGSLYLHPRTLDVVLFSAELGLRFATRLPDYASEVDDLDGVATFLEVRPGDIAFDEEEWIGRCPPALARKRLRETFSARPGAVTPVFVPLWKLLLQRGTGESFRVETIDAIAGRPVDWPESGT